MRKQHRQYKFKLFLKQTVGLIVRKNVFLNASAITFNLFICSIPFTLIITSILGYILSIDAAFEEVIRYGRELLPQFSLVSQNGDVLEGVNTLEALIEPLIGARQIFGISGLIILIFFAQGLFYTLKHVMFEVFDIQDRKGPAKELFYNFFAFGVIGGVFLFFSIAISLLSLFSFDSYQIPYTDYILELAWLSDWLTNLVPLVFTFILFYTIFRYVSERRIHPYVSLIAAVIYAILFETAKFGVSVYLEHAMNAYRFFYQGYTAILIISFWAFYTAVLFVLTSILARAYQDVYLDEINNVESDLYTEIS